LTTELLENIEAMVFDVDGVLTDGTLLLFPTGDMVRSMNIKDGYAMNHAVKKGFRLCIISGGRSELVINRLKLLGIPDVYMNIRDKAEKLKEFFESNNISPEKTLFMGDDIPDIEAMRMVGLPCCPADAADEVKDVSVYIASKTGGTGCVREMLEMVMKAQGKW